MSDKEIIDKANEITDQLEHEASKKLNEALAYHKGYVEACEEFGRRMREAVIQNQNFTPQI